MAEHYLAWWNVENLFDREWYAGRSEKLTRTLQGELAGWTQQLLSKKLDQLASVINRLNGGKGPDIMGLCEVESRHVLELLVTRLTSRHYAIIHADTADNRGIDVAFLYDPAKFKTKKSETFFHVIIKRSATRDLVQANFTVKATGRKLVLVGNHWPSRSEGEMESEPYRMAAGETLAYYHERIRELLGNDIAVVAMGDFNDEPFNRSLTDYALSCGCRETVINANNPCFFNVMWPLLAEGVGTYYFNRPHVLDQFLLSRGMVTGAAGFSLVAGSVAREIFPGMADSSDYHKPVSFGRPTDKLNDQGYSDHFPISLRLLEAS
ncbi:MAG TPA: endonuclease/exonuclease/phosphatase family protein [Geobacteraceae bacterium]